MRSRGFLAAAALLAAAGIPASALPASARRRLEEPYTPMVPPQPPPRDETYIALAEAKRARRRVRNLRQQHA